MDLHRPEPETRRVLMGTLNGTLEGDLRVSQRLRTLDFLNRNATRFLTVQDAKVVGSRWSFEGTVVSVNASSVLWVAEVGAMRPGGRRPGAPQLNRSAIRLCFPDCEVLGFLHTPAMGDPVARLNQEQNPFIAITSASMIGSDNEFAAAFLAVNRLHVFAAEIPADEEPLAEEIEAFGEELER
jgi:hypothetical protein